MRFKCSFVQHCMRSSKLAMRNLLKILCHRPCHLRQAQGCCAHWQIFLIVFQLHTSSLPRLRSLCLPQMLCAAFARRLVSDLLFAHHLDIVAGIAPTSCSHTRRLIKNASPILTLRFTRHRKNGTAYSDYLHAAAGPAAP